MVEMYHFNNNKQDTRIHGETQMVELLIRTFRKEQAIHDRKGVYARTQKLMAYNSNRIEGSTLTSEQTASLFDTGSILGIDGEVYRAKDIEEMNGHFAMFNYMLYTLEEPLSEEIIKKLHFHLKTGVFEDMANGYPVGEYKNRYNIVSDIETARPEEVAGKMQALLSAYHDSGEDGLYGKIVFHAEFEKIHPFQDGNGRVGRMILFRECLKARLIPVIVRDESKMEYYHALHEAQVNHNYELLYEYGQQQREKYRDVILPYLEYDLNAPEKQGTVPAPWENDRETDPRPITPKERGPRL